MCRRLRIVGKIYHVDVAQACNLNSNLVALIRDHLVPEFGHHGKHPARSRYFGDLPSPAYFDPWWWPVDPANRPELWGLQSNERDQLNSLCEMPCDGNSYRGFQGTLGARVGCIMLIGERPSFNTRYGSAVSPVYKLLKRLAAEHEKSLEDFHVTDLIKFRGEPGRSREDLTSQMIDVSVGCLSAELSALSPESVFLTDMANDLIQFVQSKLNVLDKRLDSVVSHPRKVIVRHWSRG